MLNRWSFSRNSVGQKGLAGYIWSTERDKSKPRLLYPARISSKIDGEIKTFSDKQKLREFSAFKPALQKNVKGTYIVKNIREEKRSIKSTPNN